MQIEFPVRINRYLFLKGYCSRRKADKLIEQNEVYINGKPAVLGQKVEMNDVVEVGDMVKEMPQNYSYYLFNKPKGVVSHNPQNNEKSTEQYFKNIQVSPVGRLDKASEGLMFLTDDGRIIDRMLNPKYEHEKEYVVRVDKEIKESLINKMNKGVNIEGYKTKPTKTNQVNNKTFNIVLTEGKKHQIRRMCAALGYQVQSLKRVRIMNLRLENIKPGQLRKLKEKEKNTLLKSLGF
jgi:23S rRNA pseudouridine2604 synthase